MRVIFIPDAGTAGVRAAISAPPAPAKECRKCLRFIARSPWTGEGREARPPRPSQRLYRHHPRRPRLHAQRISEWAAETLELDDHHVSRHEADPFTEAECVRAEEVDVHVARAPVGFEFEMMMLQVGQAVAHGLLAGLNRPGPQQAAS